MFESTDVKKIFSSTDFSEVSDRIVLADPLVGNDGSLRRDIMTTRFISQSIFLRLMKMRANILVDTLQEKFETLLLNDTWHAIAGTFFGAGGHAYVLEYVQENVLQLQRLTKDGPGDGEVVYLNLRHVRAPEAHFQGLADLPGAEDMQKNPTNYYRPQSRTLSGIDSFALELDAEKKSHWDCHVSIYCC